MKAWLVTWDWAGDHAKVENPIVSILSSRLSAKTVSERVERLYADLSYSLTERVRYVRSPKANPYPARFNAIGGVRYEGQITCGHNPWLYARIVENIRVKDDAEGNEQLLWDERPPPDLSWIKH